MSNDSKSATVSTPVPATMTGAERATLASTALVQLAPAVAYGPDGAASFAVQSMQVPAEGARRVAMATGFAHASGMTPRMAAKEASRLYRAMLADALTECGIESPVLRRAAGRTDGTK